MPVVTMRRTGAKMKVNNVALEREMAKAIKQFQKIALAEHEKVTETWEHKPQFRARRYGWLVKGQRNVVVRVWTDSDIWRYVDEGTKPHAIRPKKPGGVLVFPAKSTPKTQPRSLESGRGGQGGPLIFAKLVHHPGTKARNFTAMLQRKLDNIYGPMINAVFTRMGPHIFG